MADTIPGDLRYTETDEWVRRDGDDVVVGITAYAAEQLGDVVYVQLPEQGKSFNQGETYGEIESVKAVSDLYAPLGGEVVESNSEVEQNPGVVNEDPYGKGWLVRLRPNDINQYDSLLDAEAYERKIAEH